MSKAKGEVRRGCALSEVQPAEPNVPISHEYNFRERRLNKRRQQVRLQLCTNELGLYATEAKLLVNQKITALMKKSCTWNVSSSILLVIFNAIPKICARSPKHWTIIVQDHRSPHPTRMLMTQNWPWQMRISRSNHYLTILLVSQE